MSTQLENLIDRAWLAVEARADVTRGQRVLRPPRKALRRPRTESRYRDDFAALEELARALELAERGELGELATAVREAADQFRWSQNASYDETTVSRELLDGYAYAPLSGPDCPIPCEVPLAGFLLMKSNTVYADHRHAPREVYLVMTPGARWCLDSGEWFEVNAGDLIFHDSWQMHAMRTGDEPLLAFAAWLEGGDRAAIRI